MPNHKNIIATARTAPLACLVANVSTQQPSLFTKRNEKPYRNAMKCRAETCGTTSNVQSNKLSTLKQSIMKTQFTLLGFLAILTFSSCQKRENPKNYTCSCTTTSDRKNSTPSYSYKTVYGTKHEAFNSCSKYNKTSKSSLFANSYGQPATFVTKCSLTE